MKVTTLLFVMSSIFAMGAWCQAESAPAVPREVRENAEIFTERVIIVKGLGAAPADRPLSKAQKSIMALRAAKVVAFRELAETIEGVRLTGETFVKDAAVQSDEVRTTVNGIVKGAEVVHESYDSDLELAVVFLQLPLDGPRGAIENLTATILAQDIATQPSKPRYTPASRPETPTPEPVDSLIIDARGTNFTPALINRVMDSKGALLYGPDIIAPQILARRGCGDYTNDLGKARALLRERGVKNPLVVRAANIPQASDVQVTDEDANTIFIANEHAGFLASALVVFVM